MFQTDENKTDPGLTTFPLSPMQHGMLMQTIKSPDGAGCYIEQIMFDIDQQIDVDTFTKAWHSIVNYHDILRLGFIWKGVDFPLQYIAPVNDFKIEFNDWTGKPGAEKKEYLKTFLMADRRLGFALNQPPASRVALFKTNSSSYTCIWSFHHCIADARSMVLILKDLFIIYNDPYTQLTSPGNFKNYIDWFNKQNNTRTKEFWRKKLKGFSEPVSINFTSPSPEKYRDKRKKYAITVTTASQELDLFQSTTKVLQQICRENAITMNSLLMGAWAMIISHYTGKTDIVFGTTRSVRNWRENGKNDTGLYINTLPERIQVDPEMLLSQFFIKIRQEWRKAREFEHISLTDIHAESEIKGTTPLFDIYFAYDYDSFDNALGRYRKNLSCSEIKLFERTPASLFLTIKGKKSLSIAMEYDKRRYNRQMIEQLLGHFKNCLESVAKTPHAKINEISILSNKERQFIFNQLNTVNRTTPKLSDKCIHHFFEIQASLNKNITAVADSNSQLTYELLNSLANQTAHHLIKLGAVPETKVIVLLEQGVDLIAAILGVLKSGSSYIPLDITSPHDRLNYIIEDARPEFIITASRHKQGIIQGNAECILLDQEENTIKSMPVSNPVTSVKADNTAYIIYTSGSTGKPKGVVIEHGSLLEFTRSAAGIYDLEPHDRVLQFASISFDASAEEIFPTFFSGAALIIKPGGVIHTPDQFMTFCRENRISVLDLPTSYWHILADQAEFLSFPKSLRLIIIGGEEANAAKVKKWKHHAAEDIQLINTYGPTETTIAATWADLNNTETNTRVPIGSPFSSVNLAILNHFTQPVPVGISGELYIGGAQTARGYVNKETLTRNSFVKLKNINSSTTFFKTGDRAEMLPSGRVVFQGRIDRQVKIRGFRIEPGEIEKTALTHVSISECAVTVVNSKDTEGAKAESADTRESEQNLILVGFVLLKDKDNFSVTEFKQWLAKKIPKYMIPSLIIVLNVFPYTPSGKIDYNTLKITAGKENSGGSYNTDHPGKSNYFDRFSNCSGRSDTAYSRNNRGAEAVPEQQHRQSHADFCGKYEISLQKIWKKILDFKKFQLDDNFFDIGGSSLTAIRVITEIEKELHISLPVIAIFKASTIRDLAALLLSQESESNFSALKTLSSSGTKAPVFFIAGTTENTNIYKNINLNGHPFYTITTFAHKTENHRIIPIDVWEMAQQNISEIKRAVSTGPYIIIGFCRYAIVAHEIACQLTNTGNKVEQLVLIDEFWRKKGAAKFIGHHMHGMFRFGPVHILKKIVPKTKEKFHSWFLSLDRYREKFYSTANRPVPETLQYRLMERAFWKAYDAYMPIPYKGDALIFDSNSWREKFAPQLREYVQGNIKRVEIDTIHSKWFEPEQAESIIMKI